MAAQKIYDKSRRPIYFHNTILEGVKDGDWKLRITKKDNGNKEEELYNFE